MFIDNLVNWPILWLTLSFRYPHCNLVLFHVSNWWLILLGYESSPFCFKYWMTSILLSTQAGISIGMLDTTRISFLLISVPFFIKDFILLQRIYLFFDGWADSGEGLFWMIKHIFGCLVKIEMIRNLYKLLWLGVFEHRGLKNAISSFLLAWSTIHLIIYLINQLTIILTNRNLCQQRNFNTIGFFFLELTKQMMIKETSNFS